MMHVAAGCAVWCRLRPLVQHGVDDGVGNTLLPQINDLGRVQPVVVSRILDVIDDGAVADFRLRKLQDLRHAVGQLRRGLAGDRRLGGAGTGGGSRGILRHSVARHQSQHGEGDHCQERLLKVSSFHKIDDVYT